MTISITIPAINEIKNLSKLDKVAIIFSLAEKYVTPRNQAFLENARMAKQAGGFNKCFDICLVDILKKSEMNELDLQILIETTK